jgi:hypothetical protein
MMLFDGPLLHYKPNPRMQLEKAKKKRRTLPKGDCTRHIVATLLRRNPLLSYADIAKVLRISDQRVGQIAHEKGLDAYRKEWKEKFVARLSDRIRLPKSFTLKTPVAGQ